MSAHDKKNRDAGPPLFGRARNASSTASKSPIKTPPRAALAQSRAAGDKDESKSKNSSPKSQIPGNEAPAEIRLVEGMDMPKKENDPVLASRDLKIARLEKESGIMEEEFTQELTNLSHKLTNETEKVNLWEKKHSSLNQMFLKTDTALRVLQHDVEAREKHLEEREKDIKTRISSLLIDRDAFREGYNATQRDLKDREREVLDLKSQVRELKKFVSTKYKDLHVPRPEISNMLTRLSH